MCIGQMSIHNCCSKYLNPRGYLADAGRVLRTTDGIHCYGVTAQENSITSLLEVLLHTAHTPDCTVPLRRLLVT